MLNALLKSHFSVAKMGERAARLTCLTVPQDVPKMATEPNNDHKSLSEMESNSGESSNSTAATSVVPVPVPTTFLFIMNHSHEADLFIKHIDDLSKKYVSNL